MASDPVDPVPSDPAEAATYWRIRLRERAPSADDRAAFEAWLAADPRHARAYQHVSAILGAVRAEGDAITAALRKRRRRRRAMLVGSVLLAVAIAIAVAVWR